ncbi:ABC transporter ATP-binding protein [Thioalkalivibrio denitrificans]|uniref:ABC transporter ATP-binding protein n=1 Tax=Thioalkalivibrio denitrificans TaxID=108003 RepID=A0A1V3NK71_9GAMM|nr:ATP-binding cassette domain-containing protein [Thioalkalivibrio denitrificans]OOG25156.1 ABC transporter ATP-binding protein [Thioalkalivibrio denitrificans]
MDIHKITVVGGFGRGGEKEPLEGFELEMGDVASIVGPTGSGKTALINDIGLFAAGNTPTRRRILINDSDPPPEFLEDPARNPIALITQHTSFLSDLPVHRFLSLHAKIRKRGRPETIVEETLDFANQLTGEPINVDSAMTELSGGQSRALLIADAVVIGNSPIILLDEIENAGIDRSRALSLLRNYQKIFLFVTHDLHIALLSNARLVMRAGAMQALIATEEREQRMAGRLRQLDEMMLHFRDRIRAGERLSEEDLEARLAALTGAQP